MNAKCSLWSAAVPFALILSAGCGIHTEPAGPLQYDSKTIDKDNAKSVRVNLNMGAGNLKVGSGTQKLMQAYFTYNVPSYKPDVTYTLSDSTGDLTLRQPNRGHTRIGNVKYEWDVRLNQEVPLDVTVNFGAGEAQLDLGSLSLRNVELHMGVGQMQMDLRGNPQHDYSVHINGGVGEATVRLPSNVGIYAEASGGIGDIQVRGLNKDGGHWVNDAFQRSGVKIRLDVHGGIGTIKLLAD